MASLREAFRKRIAFVRWHLYGGLRMHDPTFDCEAFDDAEAEFPGDAKFFLIQSLMEVLKDLRRYGGIPPTSYRKADMALNERGMTNGPAMYVYTLTRSVSRSLLGKPREERWVRVTAISHRKSWSFSDD